MTIKQQGGIFGRNPTFNDVDIEGTLTVNGEPISDFGTMAQQDATSVNIDGGAVDGVTLGTNSAVTEAQVDNINLNGNTISTSSANLTLTPTDHVFVTKGGSSTATLYLSSDKYTGSTGDISSKIVLYSDNTAAWTGTREMVSLDYIGNGADHRAGSLSIKVKKGAADANPTEMLLIDGVRNTTTIQSGNLAFPSGAGIDFSATVGTGTSELFDDYEEGVYDATITPSTSGSVSLIAGQNSLQYTKVGRKVFVSGGLWVDTVSSPVGYFSISLPFASAALSEAQGYFAGCVYVQGASSANMADFVVFGVPGQSSVRIYLGDATGFQADSAEQIGNSSEIYVSLCYIAA